MKDFVKKFESFITFDLLLETANITAQFADTQQKLEAETPGWSTAATRQKLISSYWFTNVIGHFSVILGITATVIFLSTASFEKRYLLSIIMAGLLSFTVMYFFLYRPSFGSVYLHYGTEYYNEVKNDLYFNIQDDSIARGVATFCWFESKSNLLKIEGLDLVFPHLNLYEDSTKNNIYQFKKQTS